MVTLRVFLLDLLAVVDEGARKWVLLPNAVNRGRTPDDPVEPHFPMFLFERDDLNGGDWPELKSKLGLQGFRPGTAWLLDREEIVFPAPAQAGFSPAFQGVPAGDLPANPAEARSLAWIPSLTDLAPGHDRVDPACLTSPVQTPKIVARASFTGGTFRTASFTKIRSDFRDLGEILPYQFKVPPGDAPVGPVKAMTDRLVVEVPVVGDTVTIRTVPFAVDRRRPREGREVNLSPNGQGIVNVLLANVSPASPNFRARDRGLHFDAYYDLAAEPLAQEARSLPFVARNGHLARDPAVEPLDVEVELPATFLDAFRNPIGVFENRICTVARMAA